MLSSGLNKVKEYSILECNSAWTLMAVKNYNFQKNVEKGRVCLKLGIKWMLEVFDKNEALIMVFEDPEELLKVGLSLMDKIFALIIIY